VRVTQVGDDAAGRRILAELHPATLPGRRADQGRLGAWQADGTDDNAPCCGPGSP
jgi:hypothetical protein